MTQQPSSLDHSAEALSALNRYKDSHDPLDLAAAQIHASLATAQSIDRSTLMLASRLEML